MTFNVTPQLPDNGLTVAELFAGGGLMAVGLKTAGYRLIYANDFDKNAVKAYRHNLGDHIVHGDITAIDPADIPDADVIAGGPPCQDYSVAGTGAGENGERGKLVWAYLRIIEAKRPKAFIFENVKGLITKKHRPTFDALLARFEEIGYRVSWRLINAWDYGVAQKRERVFIVGIRKDLGFTFEFPEPSPEDYRTKVLRDVIGDLPEPGTFANHKGTKYVGELKDRFCYRPTSWDQPSPTLAVAADAGGAMPHPHPDWQMSNHSTYPLTQAQYEHSRDHQIGYNDSLDKPSRILRAKAENILDVPNHTGGVPAKEYPGHTASSLDEPAKTIVAGANDVPGGANCFYPPNHDPETKLPAYIQNVVDGKTTTNYGNGIPVNDGNDPARTLICEYRAKCPNEVTSINGFPRRFTVRECLRIQSVPDWYVLPDDISLSAQYRIVGNGVASRVAWYLGRALGEQLTKVIRNENVEEAV
ncbi:DNA (cytosine-5-)-methyltransferase [Brevibacillus sp. SYP-B805]|uniref:DNA cytosine methyltransferase n=1 Tax=Brevibacillus sp. SYP-B805 TaxID=1578199 RepID=UPI0013EA825F|nr:DNA cytosine methyltransferase [Brevibacillus sp. SYP-B805]NGQ95472.1 DNA (cytosine-5-)-methyltransferase [Brevibacillus sp. SYP-B805]